MNEMDKVVKMSLEVLPHIDAIIGIMKAAGVDENETASAAFSTDGYIRISMGFKGFSLVRFGSNEKAKVEFLKEVELGDNENGGEADD